MKAASFPDENDGFSLAEFDLCTFADNGSSLSSAVGYGLLATTNEATVDLIVRRSVISGNHTGGLRMEFNEASVDNSRLQYLEVTNTTISQNKGEDSQISVGSLPLDTAPISIHSTNRYNSLQIYVSQCTLSDNAAPYALTLYGTDSIGVVDPVAQANLWTVGSSSVDNSVLNKNNYVVGGDTDLAYFPELPNSLWQAMFDDTYFSNLGRMKFDSVVGSYVLTNQNFYADPGLTAFTLFGITVGNVLPISSSAVVNMGGYNNNHRRATEVTDNRGPGHPRKINARYDVGAYEVN